MAYALLRLNSGETGATNGKVTMALLMKSECEKCGTRLEPAGEAYICSYECTFCRQCTTALNEVCPNCSGELVKRPRKGKAGEL